MSSDVSLIIADNDTGAVVASHWIGGNAVVEKIFDVLQRDPDFTDTGFESWGQILPKEIRAINEARYSDGPDQDKINELISAFPCSEYMWCIIRDY